ncbi:MAG: phosphotransferase [Alphaproteobacteria bacterium]|jgi:fructosamine-3-kinase|nr:phosphotransferase [Alphaproteobacteria bacterium]MBT4710630.1 phosphotransferase [Alphaproteobacteria bacterium]MBT5860029.1 phosphotransferase [Alphaproteobacteria bacterium]
MPAGLDRVIEEALGMAPVRSRPLAGGCVGDVIQLSMPDGARLVAKFGDAGAQMDLEGWMLRYLRDHSDLPVPRVLFEADRLLIMEHLPSRGGITADAQRHGAELLAALHGVTQSKFGLEKDTLIGGLHQPNPLTKSWLEFFRDQRLMYMGAQAVSVGRLPTDIMARIETLCGKLDQWISEPSAPSLIHGDMWSGNVLCAAGRITGLIDPAIYYADPEIELAFSTLFSTFGDAFFDRYSELRPLTDGFFEERRDLYNLYPLLVHVRLFGGSYVQSVDATLARYGF